MGACYLGSQSDNASAVIAASCVEGIGGTISLYLLLQLSSSSFNSLFPDSGFVVMVPRRRFILSVASIEPDRYFRASRSFSSLAICSEMVMLFFGFPTFAVLWIVIVVTYRSLAIKTFYIHPITLVKIIVSRIAAVFSRVVFVWACVF